jgi:hypothetical protein
MLEAHFDQIRAEFMALRDKGKAFQVRTSKTKMGF